MALTAFPNNRGFGIFPTPYMSNSTQGAFTINATGEYVAFIGRLILESGSSKVFSNASKIYWTSGSITFANVATNLRVGIQDVGATGFKDGTFDVYADLVGGGGGVTADALITTSLTTGSKTIANGDLIAIVIELTARAGSDSIQVLVSAQTFCSFPYSTSDSGAGNTKSLANPMITIESDDGTLGWFAGATFAKKLNQVVFDVDDTPDEYANVFKLPVKVEVNALGGIINCGSSADYELILYGDPLGTPNALATVSVTSALTNPASGYTEFQLSSPITLERDVYYAVSARPTTTNPITLFHQSYHNSNLRKPTLLGTNWSRYSRTGLSGAFSSEDNTIVPFLGVIANKWDDGASILNLYPVE